MKVLLVVHAGIEAWDGLDEAAVSAGLTARAAAIERLRAGGHLIACSPLAEPAAGREVRVRDGAVQVTGLSASSDSIAGFYLLEVQSLQEAERLAASIPDSETAHVSVRELMALPGIPGVVGCPLPGESGG